MTETQKKKKTTNRQIFRSYYSPFLAQMLPRGYKIHHSSSLSVADSSSSSLASFSSPEPSSSALASSPSSSADPPSRAQIEYSPSHFEELNQNGQRSLQMGSQCH